MKIHKETFTSRTGVKRQLVTISYTDLETGKQANHQFVGDKFEVSQLVGNFLKSLKSEADCV